MAQNRDRLWGLTRGTFGLETTVCIGRTSSSRFVLGRATLHTLDGDHGWFAVPRAELVLDNGARSSARLQGEARDLLACSPTTPQGLVQAEQVFSLSKVPRTQRRPLLTDDRLGALPHRRSVLAVDRDVVLP